MIRVVLWDVDGTLLDFSKAEFYAFKKCFSIFSIGECTDETVARYSKINRRYWERLERNEITKPQVLLGRFSEFFESEGIAFDRLEEFNAEYQLRLGDKCFFCDGALETLNALKGRVLQYAVTNGTYAAQSRKLTRSGLIDIFDGVFISDKVGFEKPRHEFFDFVWKEIGQYEKDEVLIVGDSLTSDMRGGKNAGILSCWYNPLLLPNRSEVQPDFEIRTLSEVLNIVL